MREALRFIDTDGSGVIDRDEIKEMLFRFNILAPPGEPAHAKNGEFRVTEDVLDTFVEVCQGLSLNQGDGDTRVECDEFTKVPTLASSAAGALLPVARPLAGSEESPLDTG